MNLLRGSSMDSVEILDALTIMSRAESKLDGTPLSWLPEGALDGLVELGFAKRYSLWGDITKEGRDRLEKNRPINAKIQMLMG